MVEASLWSYEEEEAKRAAREAKLVAQEESDLICATGESLYVEKRDRVESAATSVHMGTEFAVMKARHDRVTGKDEPDRRKEAILEEERNEAQRKLVERRQRAANCVCSAVMLLINSKCAQFERDSDSKGKASSRPWQTNLTKQALETVRLDVLLERALEAGVDEVELQQALNEVSEGTTGSASGRD